MDESFAKVDVLSSLTSTGNTFLFLSQRKNGFQSLGRRPQENEFISVHEISKTFGPPVCKR